MASAKSAEGKGSMAINRRSVFSAAVPTFSTKPKTSPRQTPSTSASQLQSTAASQGSLLPSHRSSSDIASRAVGETRSSTPRLSALQSHFGYFPNGPQPNRLSSAPHLSMDSLALQQDRSMPPVEVPAEPHLSTESVGGTMKRSIFHTPPDIHRYSTALPDSRPVPKSEQKWAQESGSKQTLAKSNASSENSLSGRKSETHLDGPKGSHPSVRDDESATSSKSASMILGQPRKTSASGKSFALKQYLSKEEVPAESGQPLYVSTSAEELRQSHQRAEEGALLPRLRSNSDKATSRVQPSSGVATPSTPRSAQGRSHSRHHSMDMRFGSEEHLSVMTPQPPADASGSHSSLKSTSSTGPIPTLPTHLNMNEMQAWQAMMLSEALAKSTKGAPPATAVPEKEQEMEVPVLPTPAGLVLPPETMDTFATPSSMPSTPRIPAVKPKVLVRKNPSRHAPGAPLSTSSSASSLPGKKSKDKKMPQALDLTALPAASLSNASSMDHMPISPLALEPPMLIPSAHTSPRKAESVRPNQLSRSVSPKSIAHASPSTSPRAVHEVSIPLFAAPSPAKQEPASVIHWMAANKRMVWPIAFPPPPDHPPPRPLSSR